MATRNLGIVEKLDYLMSPERDAPNRPAGAERRYALLSTPRCGSNLVGDMLQATGAAGDPMEYLNGRYIAAWARLRGAPLQFDMARYMAEMETRRTTPNGFFGVKIHFEHLQQIWNGRELAAAQWLRRYDRVVLLWRRDKIAQAVSLHKARVTQIWSSQDLQFLPPDDPRRLIKATYSAPAIAQALADLVKQEDGWRRFLAQHQIAHTELCYEDFVHDYAGQSRQLLAVLGIESAQLPQAPRLTRQGVDNDPMIDAFRREIGWTAQ